MGQPLLSGWGWTTDRQTNENGDRPHNICHYFLINTKPLILSNCRCGARLGDRCRNIWWWSGIIDRDIGSWHAFEGALNIIPDSKSTNIILHCESPCSKFSAPLSWKSRIEKLNTPFLSMRKLKKLIKLWVMKISKRTKLMRWRKPKRDK